MGKKAMRLSLSMQILAAVLLMTVLCVCTAGLLSRGALSHNIELMAQDEVTDAARSQCAAVQKLLDSRFTSLDTLASCLSDAELSDPDELLRTFFSVNDAGAVAYTDLDGNILRSVSANPGDLTVTGGNIADRRYFQTASARQGARAVEYDSETGKMLMAVPLQEKSVVTGVLFLMTEQRFFEDMFLDSGLEDPFEVFLIESDGRIIADRQSSGSLQFETDIFSSLMISKSKAVSVRAALAAGESCELDVGDKYAAFESLGFDGLAVACVLDKADAAQKFSANTQELSRLITAVSVVFILCGAVMFILFVFLEQKSKKRTEEILRYSDKVRGFLTESGNLAFDFDSRTLKLSASAALEDYLDFPLPADWFTNLPEYCRNHPEFNYKEVIEAYNNILLTGDYQEIVTSLRLERRGLRWIKISMTASRAANNRDIQGVFGIVTDITDSYADAQLVRTEREYIFNAVFSFVPMAVSADLTLNAYSLINYAPADSSFPWTGVYDALVEQVVKELPEDYRPRYRDTFSREALLTALEQGQGTVELEHPVLNRKDNKTMWSYSKVYFLRGGSGENVRILMIVLDITQQKENERLLQRSYDLMSENMPGFACKWLFDGSDILLLDANPSFYRFLQTSEAQARGHSIFYGLDEEEKQTLVQRFYALAAEEKELRHTGRGCKFNGEEFWFSVSGTYLEQQDGKPVYFCILSDLTDIVRLREQALMDAQELSIAAGMSDSVTLKYDVLEHKLHLLSGGNQDEHLALLDGHAPEYGFEAGFVLFTVDAMFYDAFKAIDLGSLSGSIRVAFGTAKQHQWFSGRYQTVFNRAGKPVSAILVLRKESGVGINTTASLLADFYDDEDARSKKMMIVCLTNDLIEYETETHILVFGDEGIHTFSDAKDFMERNRFVSEDCLEECRAFLDTDHLIELYRSGVVETSLECRGKTGHGDDRQVIIHVFLRESKLERSIKACIIFEDVLADRERAAQERTEPKAWTAPVGEKRVAVRTFGYFDVFIDGKPVSFSHEKSKEMLAVLVDRRGGFVSNNEMISYLWEDEDSNKTTQSRCRQVACRLKHILDENGIGDIIETVNGRRRIIPEKVSCDYLDYLSDQTTAPAFNGFYMMNYSWSEVTLADLENRRGG